MCIKKNETIYRIRIIHITYKSHNVINANEFALTFLFYLVNKIPLHINNARIINISIYLFNSIIVMTSVKVVKKLSDHNLN